MGAAPIARPLPDLRLRLLKAAVVIPDLMISGLLWLMVRALLPTEVAVGFLTGLLAISIVVASGRAEGLAVRVLHASRRPTPFEGQWVAQALRRVAERSGPADLRVLIGQGDEPVSAAGRQHVILHREVVDAHRAGRITDAEVAALLAHGVGRLRLGQPRLDLLVNLWTLPWDTIRGLVVGLGRQLSWVPFGRLAWQTRFVVGTIAVVIEAQAGRWPSPIVIAVFLTLSYLLPRWRNGYRRQLDRHAHHAAIQIMSGLAVAEFIPCPSTSQSPSRSPMVPGPDRVVVRALEHPTSRPALRGAPPRSASA